MSKFKMELGRPIVVAQAAPGVDKWGQWQFPSTISRMRDGGIALQYSVGQDSAAGAESACTVSYDEGETWRTVDVFPSPNGVRLRNGDMLRLKHLSGLDADWVELPPYDRRWYAGVVEYDFYCPEAIPFALRGYRMERCASDESVFHLERHHLATPGEYMNVTRDDMSCHPFGTAGDYLNPQNGYRLRVAPNGDVWLLTYQNMKRDGEPLYSSTFFVSTDDGRSFAYRSHIAYDESFELPVEQRAHPNAYYEGFCEPDVAFMPDGSILCLMRIGSTHLPSHLARSVDGGYHWSRPAPFDEMGIMPGFAQLGNGATVVTYGRPGVHLRACCDPEGRAWGDRLTVVPVDHPTCANSGILALDNNTALLTYSDFRYPNEEGVPVKTVLARKVYTQVEQP